MLYFNYLCYINLSNYNPNKNDLIGIKNNQLCICVDALSRQQGDQYSDTARVDGKKSQDLANVVVIDTSSKVIKIIRVGADTNR